MVATIEVKKKCVRKSNRNKKTGNEEDDDVVVLEEDDEEDEQQDVEEDEEESEEDEEEEKEDVEEDEEEDKFMKWDMSDLPEALARTPLESLNPEMVKDAELEPNNEKEKKLLHFLEQIENESDVKDTDTQECSLDNDGSEFEKDEEVKETNNDTNNLISDLLKEIDRLKEESKEKDRVIQTLQQKIAELERDHVPYQDAAEQMFDYETKVGTVHVEKGILQEEIVQKEVEIRGLYVSNDLLEEKLEKSEKDKTSFEDGLDDIVTHMVTQVHVRKTSLRKAFVWHNQVNNDIVTIEDVLNLLNDGDIGNTKEYVEEQMRKLTLSKPPSFELISTPKPTLFPINTLSAPISSIDDAPQQQLGSVDCGLIVCYIIKQLAEQKSVPIYLTVENLKKFRAELIHMLLNDKPRTWSAEEWKSEQLMHGMTI
ncbi:hypothetical protein RHSIM_Rhsim09G0061900 [Rhododendron simsii]|uniref:Uncharacterized protein n=1 Tax=Rhododendron simsii TaxID=118357 RepID=A0A834LCJ4_RHOSS|nr:hypothetical protein RHSIM_Rhsim09G0061900 [Rhododendron simsii]